MLARSKIIGLCLGTLLFLILLATPMPTLTHEAKRMAAIALLMATWWISEAIPLPATALLPILLYPLMNIMSSKEVSMHYANHLIFLFIGGFILAAAIQKWNLHKRIALNIIRFIGTNLYQLLFGFMCATAFLAMWISNTATAMMMLPIAMAVTLQLSFNVSYEGKSGRQTMNLFNKTFGMVLMLGIAYAASIGGIGTLIGTPPNIVFAGLAKEIFPAAKEIGFAQWTLIGTPILIIFLPTVWFILAFFASPVPLKNFKFSDENKDVVREELKNLGPMRLPEKLVSLVFLITVFLWMFRIPIKIGPLAIPGWSELFSQSQAEYLHDSTVAISMAILLFLIPSGNKEKPFLLDWKTARTKIPWGIVLLFGGGFALAAGFKETGLDKWIGNHLNLLTGFPTVLMILAICLVVTFLTEVTSNTATATMILPILAATAVGLGKHPFLLMIPAALSASCAFMLPVATPPNAIVFGSGWIQITKMARIGFILNIVGALLITAIVYVLLPLVFGIKFDQLPTWVVP